MQYMPSRMGVRFCLQRRKMTMHQVFKHMLKESQEPLQFLECFVRIKEWWMKINREKELNLIPLCAQNIWWKSKSGHQILKDRYKSNRRMYAESWIFNTSLVMNALTSVTYFAHFVHPLPIACSLFLHD